MSNGKDDSRDRRTAPICLIAVRAAMQASWGQLAQNRRHLTVPDTWTFPSALHILPRVTEAADLIESHHGGAARA
jgi:hypothetical protein